MYTLFIIVVFVCVIIIILLLINKYYKRTNYFTNQFMDIVKFSSGTIPQNLGIVNLGSNQPKFAFDYSESCILGMNLAIGPQSLEYDFRVLIKYHSFLCDKAFVVIPICPFNFFLFRYPYDSANYKYYQFLDPKLINNYSSRTKMLYIDYPVLTAKRNLLRIIKDVPVDNRMSIKENPMSDDELKSDAKKWINNWLKEFSLTDLNDIHLSEKNKKNMDKNVAILSEMIDFCSEKNYSPVIVMLPVTRILSDLFTQSFIDRYIVTNIEKANAKKVPVLNYMKDERFISPELYFNSFFFNEKGRKYFTKMMIKDLSVL